ncbi:cytochrome c biogenesis protein ResB [Actomonas aquatica]|uniref:Cytochrome c biogenesis protein ResB n=1 Tax=Actomonas aquatica TaxID=2866162 RepID=A0ABZ1C3T5_9BACT|nr:cytochrome c biogenesis protein ResB [Opitutus sp. WL0086]WRQ86352.1 cytochrome c biogenesis protein ResB [Opitutus sp. WL0086]
MSTAATTSPSLLRATLRTLPLGNTWSGAALVLIGTTAAGFGVDFALHHHGFPIPVWPLNGILLAAWIALQLLTYFTLRGTSLLATLAGSRLAVLTLAGLATWGAVLGTFPQITHAHGEPVALYQRVLTAPPFVFLLLLLTGNLAWATLTHLARGLHWSSLFLFNHVGVYVALTAALFGVGDLRRLDLWVSENGFVWQGTDNEAHTTVETPFAIHLQKLTVDYYPPQLTLLHGETGEPLLARGEDLLTLTADSSGTLAGYAIEVFEVTHQAPWSAAADDGVAAARLKVTAPDGRSAEGWVSAGNARVPPLFVGLGDVVATMPELRAHLFQSDFTLVRPDQEPLPASIQVNRPLRVDGWWLYQKGYDTARPDGLRWSQIEAIRDPWLPAVYTGFAFMSLGALLGLGRAAGLLRQLKTLGPEDSA